MARTHATRSRAAEPEGPSARLAQTRIRLREALISLSLRRGYDGVTVRALTAAAGLHRGTFYQHYRDKDDLLLRCMDDVHDELRARVDGVEPAQAISERAPLPLRVVFEHAAEHAAFYRWMLAAPLGQPFVDRLRRSLVLSAERRLGRLAESMGASSRVDPTTRALAAASAVEALLGGLRWFVAQPDPPAPAWIAERLGRLLLRGALDLLADAR